MLMSRGQILLRVIPVLHISGQSVEDVVRYTAGIY